jgi:hypothetical protein
MDSNKVLAGCEQCVEVVECDTKGEATTLLTQHQKLDIIARMLEMCFLKRLIILLLF